VVWVDDAQVIAATIRKQYIERWQAEGVLILVGTFPTPGGEDEHGLE
jgi:hypothetical protein